MARKIALLSGSFVVPSSSSSLLIHSRITSTIQKRLYSPQPLEQYQEQKERIKNAKPFSEFLTDNFNRHHTYLRISLTERCNLRCRYCMPEEGVLLSQEKLLLTSEEIVRLAKLFVSEGVNKIRLTGGEPTVRKDLIHIVEELGKLKSSGLEKIGMTSNGIVLKRMLKDLKIGGLDQLNISLDTFDENKFEFITRRKGFKNVMESIETALALDFEVKLNVVVLRSQNEEEVCNFVEFTRDKNITVRFIEYMPFDGNKWNTKKFIPYRQLLANIQEKYPSIKKVSDSPNDTSKHYQVDGFLGKIGFITSMSDHFCGTCNRTRITADGNYKVCLFGASEVSLRDAMRSGMNDEELLHVISDAIKRKKEKHAGMLEISKLKNRPMVLIGG